MDSITVIKFHYIFITTRASNWELREKEKIPDILEDLRKFIGFQEA